MQTSTISCADLGNPRGSQYYLPEGILGTISLRTLMNKTPSLAVGSTFKGVPVERRVSMFLGHNIYEPP